jgi:hypothetical protein
MNIAQTIRDRVETRGSFRDHVEELVANDLELTVRCALSSADGIGCGLLSVQIADERPGTFAASDVVRLADGICGKVTYLLEPLRTIEVDSRAPAALVRSAVPRLRGESLCYYELLVGGDHRTTVQRYSFDKAAHERKPVEILLTKDQLEVLIADLVSAYGRGN